MIPWITTIYKIYLIVEYQRIIILDKTSAAEERQAISPVNRTKNVVKSVGNNCTANKIRKTSVQPKVENTIRPNVEKNNENDNCSTANKIRKITVQPKIENTIRSNVEKNKENANCSTNLTVTKRPIRKILNNAKTPKKPILEKKIKVNVDNIK